MAKTRLKPRRSSPRRMSVKIEWLSARPCSSRIGVPLSTRPATSMPVMAPESMTCSIDFSSSRLEMMKR